MWTLHPKPSKSFPSKELRVYNTTSRVHNVHNVKPSEHIVWEISSLVTSQSSLYPHPFREQHSYQDLSPYPIRTYEQTMQEPCQLSLFTLVPCQLFLYPQHVYSNICIVVAERKPSPFPSLPPSIFEALPSPYSGGLVLVYPLTQGNSWVVGTDFV